MVWYFLAPKWPILVPFYEMDHQYLIPFLSEAVEASWWYFFENWLMKHKWATLMTMQQEIYYRNSQFFYPSELFTLDHFLMRHPVEALVFIWVFSSIARFNQVYKFIIKCHLKLYCTNFQLLNIQEVIVTFTQNFVFDSSDIVRMIIKTIGKAKSIWVLRSTFHFFCLFQICKVWPKSN